MNESLTQEHTISLFLEPRSPLVHYARTRY